MKCLLDTVTECLSVAYLPELLVKTFLPGDNSLDDATIDRVFTKKYTRDGYTYLDPGCTVPHSFDNQPCVRDGRQIWFRNGKRHRENDLPAFIDDDSQIWYKHGQRHRENDLPAYILRTTWSAETWFKNGKRHRDNDLPAQVSVFGHRGTTRQWFKNGKRHRENDLPAYVSATRSAWYKDDKLHRENGQPAIISKMFQKLKKLWYCNGQRYHPQTQ